MYHTPQRKYRRSNQSIPLSGEFNNGKMLTLPNQAPSMRDLLSRHALGITDSVQYNGNFTGDLPDLRGIEPHDLSTMIYENQTKLKELEEIKNTQASKLRQAKYEAKKESDKETYLRLQKEFNKVE